MWSLTNLTGNMSGSKLSIAYPLLLYSGILIVLHGVGWLQVMVVALNTE